MIIILPRRSVVLPGAAAEFRQPVVRRPAVRLPDRARCTSRACGLSREAPAFDEPGMLVGGVVRHQIEDDLEPALMRGVYQRVEIRHRAEQRIDAGIVGDVVAEIGHRRGKDRRQPDRVDAERLQIGQPLDDPGDIADAVGIGVLKRARIYLIENAVPPPGFVALIHLRDHSLKSRVPGNAGTVGRQGCRPKNRTPDMTGRSGVNPVQRADIRGSDRFSTQFSLGEPQKIGIVLV